MKIWRLRIAFWITKATNTHSEYSIIIAFPLPTMVARKRLIVTLQLHCLYCVLKYSLAAHRIRILVHTCSNWKDAAVPTKRYTL